MSLHFQLLCSFSRIILALVNVAKFLGAVGIILDPFAQALVVFLVIAVLDFLDAVLEPQAKDDKGHQND